jgi:hypothetical protein
VINCTVSHIVFGHIQYPTTEWCNRIPAPRESVHRVKRINIFIYSLWSNDHLNLMRFGQIRRFPSRKQPVDDFRRDAELTRAILFV